MSTLDGCNSNSPPKLDLLKAYSAYMNKQYLEIVETFWNRAYSEINLNDILKISSMLFNMGEKLSLMKVDDPNFYKNGKILINIYMKKTYNNLLAIIENILKDEREKKAIVDNNNKYYYSHGPQDLFELLARTFDLIKEYQNKYFYESILKLYNSCTYQYLLGVETTLKNTDYILDKEFLLAMANNSMILIKLLNKLIDDIKILKVLDEKEIKQSFKLEKFLILINFISQKAITTFVYYFLNELGQYFKTNSFISLDLSQILVRTNEIFGQYREYMNELVLKKTWNEILKLTLYHYINLFLTSKFKGVTVEQIKTKLKNDIGLLNETYEGLVGKNLTISTTKVLNDLHDFLESSSYMISSLCLTLRQYIGPLFNFNIAKTLIKLRKDIQSDEIKDSLDQCKEVLDKYSEKNNKENEVGINYFKIVENEMKRQNKEEKGQKNINELGQQNAQNAIMVVDEEDEGLFEMSKEDEMKTFNLDDFINEEEEEKKNYSESIKYKEEDKEVGQEEVSDIVCEGVMEKKTYRKWQSRYFQVKNGYLFWFKEKNSSLAQNKISIKNILKVESHKDKKFMIVVNFTENEAKNEEEDGEKNYELNGKVYKFACKNDDEKNKWITAISNEMKRLKKSEEKKQNYKFEIPIRKKVIIDHFDYPEINNDINYMKKHVLEEMNREKFFKPSKRKEEMLKKEKEQKEKEKKAQEKIENNKKIEQDIKDGKEVTLGNKLKSFFNNSLFGKKNSK